MELLDIIVDTYRHDEFTGSGFHDLAASGVRGIVQKATEGVNFKDPTYADRRKRAGIVGLKFGAYHFGRAGSGRAQADAFLDYATPSTSDLVALDWEYHLDDPRDYLSLYEAEQFVLRVRDRLGRLPVLYASWGFLTDRDSAALKRSVLSCCPLWLAWYPSMASRNLTSLGTKMRTASLPWALPKLWQWTESGTIAGVTGLGDRNYLVGELEDLVKWPF